MSDDSSLSSSSSFGVSSDVPSFKPPSHCGYMLIEEPYNNNNSIESNDSYSFDLSLKKRKSKKYYCELHRSFLIYGVSPKEFDHPKGVIEIFETIVTLVENNNNSSSNMGSNNNNNNGENEKDKDTFYTLSIYHPHRKLLTYFHFSSSDQRKDWFEAFEEAAHPHKFWVIPPMPSAQTQLSNSHYPLSPSLASQTPNPIQPPNITLSNNINSNGNNSGNTSSGILAVQSYKGKDLDDEDAEAIKQSKVEINEFLFQQLLSLKDTSKSIALQTKSTMENIQRMKINKKTLAVELLKEKKTNEKLENELKTIKQSLKDIYQFNKNKNQNDGIWPALDFSIETLVKLHFSSPQILQKQEYASKLKELQAKHFNINSPNNNNNNTSFLHSSSSSSLASSSTSSSSFDNQLLLTLTNQELNSIYREINNFSNNLDIINKENQQKEIRENKENPPNFSFPASHLTSKFPSFLLDSLTSNVSVRVGSNAFAHKFDELNKEKLLQKEKEFEIKQLLERQQKIIQQKQQNNNNSNASQIQQKGKEKR